LEWDAVITAQERNKLLAWKSLPDSAIQHAGLIRFQQNADGTTTVHIHMSYNPPAGALGHALATVLGADPKKKMDDESGDRACKFPSESKCNPNAWMRSLPIWQSSPPQNLSW
jgi:uncharacterized membrane protein